MESLAALPVLVTCGVLFITLPWVPNESSGARKALFVLLSALRAVYLVWRVGYTLPPPSVSFDAVFAYAFLGIELSICFASQRFLASILNTVDRSSEADRNDRWYDALAAAPLVDVFVPTYNEAASIVEKTLVGALKQDYPRFRVWVLDDGRRPWLAKLASDLGVGYITRADNAHAKAGNLNHALRHVLALVEKPDFVAVLDADFIPRSSFLRRTIALMREAKVALVQTPQGTRNPDLFQAAFAAVEGWPDTQRFQFAVVEPACDASGAAFCCGTSFLARTAALVDIGGFPTEAVTEDVLTSTKMGLKGWRTVFLGETLSTGLAPEGLPEYLTQRGRWALGGAQIARWMWTVQLRDRPLIERLTAVEGMLRWGYTSALRLMFLCVPVVTWYTGVPPLRATAASVVLFALPALCCVRVFMTWVGRGSHMPLLYEATVVLSAPVVIRGYFQGLFQKKAHRFAVTEKGRGSDDLTIYWSVLRWFAGYAALLIGGVAYSAATGKLADVLAADFGMFILAWTCLELLVVVVACVPCLERARRRREDRYATSETAIVRIAERSCACTLVDLSASGAAAHVPLDCAIGDECEVHLSGVGPIAALVVRRMRNGAVGVRFEMDDPTRRRLIEKLFTRAGYVPDVREGSLWIMSKAMLATLRP